MAPDTLEEEFGHAACIDCLMVRYRVRLLTQTIDDDKEHIMAVLVSRERLVIYCQVLSRALRYRKRV
jgi:hypothetical protein